MSTRPSLPTSDLTPKPYAIDSNGPKARPPRRPPACPGPLEVEAADAAVDVEDLAAEVEVLATARFHSGQIDLLERDAACRHLGVVEAAVADDGERAIDKIANDAAA